MIIYQILHFSKIFNDFIVSKDKFGEQYVVDVDKWSNCVIDEEEEEDYEDYEDSEDSEILDSVSMSIAS